MYDTTPELITPAEQEAAEKELRRTMEKAEKVISDPDKLDRLLQRAEKKLQGIPRVGSTVANAPTMIELIKDYFAKEYIEIEKKSLLAIVGTIIYFAAPIDLIPDWIPAVGHLDDAAIITAALILVKPDIEKYRQWRRVNGKEITQF